MHIIMGGIIRYRQYAPFDATVLRLIYQAVPELPWLLLYLIAGYLWYDGSRDLYCDNYWRHMAREADPDITDAAFYTLFQAQLANNDDTLS